MTADRLDDLDEQVNHDGYVEGLDAIRLMGIAKAYRDGDDRLARAYLQRLLGEAADSDGSWPERVADTTRRAQ